MGVRGLDGWFGWVDGWVAKGDHTSRLRNRKVCRGVAPEWGCGREGGRGGMRSGGSGVGWGVGSGCDNTARGEEYFCGAGPIAREFSCGRARLIDTVGVPALPAVAWTKTTMSPTQRRWSMAKPRQPPERPGGGGREGWEGMT
jgi:hypothetical protein